MSSCPRSYILVPSSSYRTPRIFPPSFFPAWFPFVLFAWITWKLFRLNFTASNWDILEDGSSSEEEEELDVEGSSDDPSTSWSSSVHEKHVAGHAAHEQTTKHLHGASREDGPFPLPNSSGDDASVGRGGPLSPGGRGGGAPPPAMEEETPKHDGAAAEEVSFLKRIRKTLGQFSLKDVCDFLFGNEWAAQNGDEWAAGNGAGGKGGKKSVRHPFYGIAPLVASDLAQQLPEEVIGQVGHLLV